MKTITLGESGLECSPLAYGCWRVTGVINHPPIDDKHEKKGREAIAAAYEVGYTLFDLADIYSDGLVEEVFGRTLKEVPGMRDNIIITTKCGIRKKSDPENEAPYRYDLSREHILRSCEASLRRMGVDCIDLYQLHRPDYLMDPQEIASAFEELKKGGKAREFGVSNFTVDQLDHLQSSCPMKLVCNQIEISLINHDALNDGSLNHYRRNNITPLAWSPLAQGKLGSSIPDLASQPQPFPGTGAARRAANRGTPGGMQPDRRRARLAVAPPGRDCADHRKHQPRAHSRCHKSG